MKKQKITAVGIVFRISGFLGLTLTPMTVPMAVTLCVANDLARSKGIDVTDIGESIKKGIKLDVDCVSGKINSFEDAYEYLKYLGCLK